jgi:hypothetical protein
VSSQSSKSNRQISQYGLSSVAKFSPHASQGWFMVISPFIEAAHNFIFTGFFHKPMALAASNRADKMRFSKLVYNAKWTRRNATPILFGFIR